MERQVHHGGQLRVLQDLFHYCIEREIPFIYASSAATYGGRNDNFIEDPKFEQPLNVYGYSKQLFDQYVRRWMPEINSQVVGLKYFNVYGPREQHKGSMASVAFHLNTQVKKGENPKLFEGCDGFPNGGQMRDFIYVDDVCKVNLWFWQNPQHSGIFNCGTGTGRTVPERGRSGDQASSEGCHRVHSLPGSPQGPLSELHPGRHDQAARRRL